tara:strand:- start:1681 stop:2097 length:417 start_codon:yes stop_codon:yes gene_type:complete
MKAYKPDQSTPDILEEPVAVYGHSNYFVLASHSVSKRYIKEVIKISGLSLNDLIEILPISIDTYKRKTAFSPAVTEKILEIEEVYRKGIAAFGKGFLAWMDAENIALGNVKPKVLLKNSFGIRRLLDQIGRMEHGVLA